MSTMFTADGTDRLFLVSEEATQRTELTEVTLDTCEWEYRKPGSFTFSGSPLHPVLRRLPLRQRDAEIRVVTAEGDEHWGIPTSVGGDTSRITYNCVGILDHIGRRFVDRHSLKYTAVEQMDIIENIIGEAQDESDVNFPYRYVNIWARKLFQDITPKTRLREYRRYDHANMLDLIDEFGGVDPPLGWRMSWDQTSDAPEAWTRYLDIFPSLDTVYPLAFELVLEENGKANNIESISWGEDAGDLANSVWCTGGSAGEVRYEGHAVNGNSVQMHHDHTAIVSFGDSKDPEWLEDRAKEEVARRGEPSVELSVTLAITPPVRGALVQEGQVWPLKLDYGRIQYEGLARIMRKSYKNRQYTLTFEAVLPSAA